MKYEHMIPAVFQSRPNRFIAYAGIGGTQVTCHVKNTGRCRELLVPGAALFLQHHPDAAAHGVRILAYDCHVTPNSLDIDRPVPVTFV